MNTNGPASNALSKRIIGGAFTVAKTLAAGFSKRSMKTR